MDFHKDCNNGLATLEKADETYIAGSSHPAVFVESRSELNKAFAFGSILRQSKCCEVDSLPAFFGPSRGIQWYTCSGMHAAYYCR